MEDVEATDEEEAHQVVRRMALSLGVSDTENVQIIEGLVGGEDVVIVGQHHLRDGARVRLNTEEKAADSEGDEG